MELGRLPTPRAFPTHPMPTRIDVGVGRVEGVPVDAMGLALVDALRALSSKEVLADGHRLTVGRITAPSVATQMIEVESVRHGSDKQFVSDSMGVSHRFSATASVNLPVSLTEGGEPGPALVRPTTIDLRPEPFSERSCLSHDSFYSGVRSVYISERCFP